MNSTIKWMAAGLIVAGSSVLLAPSASAQVVVYRPLVAPVPVTSYYAPTTTYYAPSAPVTSYYAPTTTYYAPAAPVTTYYAPTTAYYGATAPVTAYYGAAPVTTYYAPAVTGAVVYRPNPVLRPFRYVAAPTGYVAPVVVRY